MVTTRPNSAVRLVTSASAIPQGTMRSYSVRSGLQLSANPCIVTPFATRTPIAQILRSRLVPVAGSHTPERSSHAGRVYAELRARVHDRLLYLAYVAHHIDWLGEANDGVADELTGTVPRDAAAPVDIDDLTAVRWAIPLGSALTGRIDGLMLHEQHAVFAASHHLGVLVALARPRLAVRDQART